MIFIVSYMAPAGKGISNLVSLIFIKNLCNFHHHFVSESLVGLDTTGLLVSGNSYREFFIGIRYKTFEVTCLHFIFTFLHFCSAIGHGDVSKLLVLKEKYKFLKG